MRLVLAMPRFDPESGHYKAFIKTIVNNSAANILRQARATKRDYRGLCSLSSLVNTGDGEVELGATISQRELDACRGHYRRSDAELLQLSLDLKGEITRLPLHLRAFAEQLQSQPVSEIARSMNVPRTTLYAWVRKLRRRFEHAGLRDYL